MVSLPQSRISTRRLAIYVCIGFLLSIFLGIVAANYPIVVSALLALSMLVVAALPFLTYSVKAVFEPIVVVCVICSTYAIGALDLIFFRGMRIIHNRDTVDAGLFPNEAAYFLSLALLLVILGLLSFYVGYYWLGSRTASRSVSDVTKRTTIGFPLFWESLPAISILVILALLEFARLSGALGGFVGVVERMRHSTAIASDSGVAISTRFVYLLPAILVWMHATYVLMERRSRLAKVLLWITSFLVVSAQLVLGNRTRAIVPIMAILLIHLTATRLTLGRKLVRILVVGLVLLLILSGVVAWRAYSGFQSSTAFDYERATSSVLEGLSLQGMYFRTIRSDEFTNIALLSHLIYKVPDEAPFLYGETFAYWVQLFLPNQFSEISLTGSKVTAGQTVVKLLVGQRDDGGGIPPNFIGELYINFWVPGVVFGMLALGYFLHILYSWYSRNREGPYILFIFAFLTANFAGLLLRNDLSTLFFVSFYGFIAASIVALSAVVIHRLLFGSSTPLDAARRTSR